MAGPSPQEAPNVDDGGTFCFPMSVCSDTDNLEVFIGLQLEVGTGMIDTGAQHAVCGRRQFDEICEGQRRLMTP